MNKQFISFCFVLLALALPFSAQAEIYKQVDADGHVTYSNVKIKGAKKIMIEPADTSFGTSGEGSKRANSRSATPASFPKVDSETQKQRDGSRREILQSELETEKMALTAAEKAYAEGEADPEVSQIKKEIIVTNKDGTKSKKVITDRYRNVAKFEEKMKPLREAVETHKRNVELLEKEIGTAN